MLSAFEYKKMWKKLKKELNVPKAILINAEDIKNMMNKFEEDYIKGKLGYHDVEEFYKD